MHDESTFSRAPAAKGGKVLPPRRRRRFRFGAVVCTGVVLAGSGLAEGIETGPEIRIRGGAMSIGAHFVLSRPGSAPMEPVFDVTFGAAGGGHDQLINQNFGFASSFYPGNTPATPGSVLGLAGFPIGGQVFPPEHPIHQGYSSIPGLIPPWPLATQGSYPGNPGRRVDMLADVTGTVPAPLPVDLQGMTQETVVDEDVVTAVTNVERLEVSSLGGLNPELEPLVAQLETVTRPFTGGGAGVRGSSLTLKGLNARYESVNTGDAARSTSEVTVREVELFGGLLEFFRVRSLADYTGGADGAKLTKQTTEVGLAKVLGVEVTFDDRGMKLADQRIPASRGAAVTKALDEILTRAGFTVETTTARVEGNKVEEVALRVVMAEQEPDLPGMTFIGRKTTVTFEIGSLASDFETLARASTGSDGGLGSEPDEGDAPTVGVSLPGAGLSSAGGKDTSPSEPSAAPAPRGTRASSANGGARVHGPRQPTGPAGSSSSAWVPAGTDGTAGTDAGEVAAALPATRGPAQGSATRPAARAAKQQPSEAPLILLPGVVASDAEQRQIAAGIEDLGRRILVLAGIGSAAGLVVWRRRRGILQ